MDLYCQIYSLRFISFLEELILTWLIKVMYELLYKEHCLLLNALIAVLTVISEGYGGFLFWRWFHVLVLISRSLAWFNARDFFDLSLISLNK